MKRQSVSNLQHEMRSAINRLLRTEISFRRLRQALVWSLSLALLLNTMALPLAQAAPAERSAPNLSSSSSSIAFQSQTITVFGPQQVTQQTFPTTYTAQFARPGEAVPTYNLTIRNGSLSGTNKVTSARVRINGTDVFTPSYNTLTVSPQTHPVSLTANNTIQVNLIGPTNSYVTITITAVRALLTTAAPTTGTQGQTLSVTLTGQDTHWATDSQVSFGGEVITNSVTFNSATSLAAQISVTSAAALAPRTITVTTPRTDGTGNEVVSLNNGFVVTAASPPGAATSVVTTFTGTAGSAGFTDGSAGIARFYSPNGIAINANDDLFIADSGNHLVRQIDANGAVTTLAGQPDPGFVDDSGTNARFNNPQGLAVDQSSGVIYVADTNNHRIRRIDTSGNVTTLAGDGTAGFADGTGTSARFNAPRGVAVSSLGDIYVADTGNQRVRKVTTSGVVTTLAGDGTPGSSDGIGTAARFNGLAGVAVDGQQLYVYLADGNNHRLRRVDGSNSVITLAGNDRGFADGTASQARFADPIGLAMDGAGHIIVADATNSLIREVDPARAINGEPQAVFTIAGTGERGSTNGAGNVARFNTPRGVVVAKSSAVFVADTANHTVRRILLPPVIASLNPAQGNTGIPITINGNRFDGRGPSYNTVRFTASGGGTVNAVVTAASRSQLTITVPSTAVTGAVTVQTQGGTSNGVTFTIGSTPQPVIASFTPTSGPVGTLVTINGTNLKVGATNPTVTFAGTGGTRLAAQVSFATATEVRATVPNAAVTGVIQLTTSAGMATSAIPFTVQPSQDYAITLEPSSRTVVQGSSVTYIVSVNSLQPNFTQLVSLTATGLPAGALASFSPAQITADAKSTLTIRLTPSVTPTSYSFTVQGTTKVDGSDLTRTATASFTVMAAGTTTLSGRVLSTEGEPVVGAYVTAPAPGGTVASDTTDGAGNFLLSGLQAGPARPIFIQKPAGTFYPNIKEPADVVAGQANTVPYIFYLPRIDPTNTPINPNGATLVYSTRPGLGELKMTIPQGISLRELDGFGNPIGNVMNVSLTPVPVDRTPAPLPTPLPNQPRILPPMIFTSQPGNACVWNPTGGPNGQGACYTDDSGPKMPVVYPNLSGANPGARIPLWAFNHNTVAWEQYGMGTVSADGKRIDPDAGVGLRDFSWHFPAPPSGNGNPGDPSSCPSNRGGNTVDYSTGMKIETMTDIAIGGARGGLALMRTYTSDQAISYGGLGGLSNVYRFGVGTRDNYDVRLIGAFATNGAGYLVLPEQTPFFAVGAQIVNGGRLFSYDAALSASGTATFTNTTTAGLLGDTIRRIDAQTLEYRSQGGFIMRFEPNPNPPSVPETYHRLKSIVDRNGNTTTLSYTGNNLTQVTDAVGRTLTFSYSAPSCAKCVSQVVAGKAGDPLQRSATYTYDSASRLLKVTDQLGKDYQYGYETGGGVNDNCLTQVTDRRGNVIKQLGYDSNRRVITQTFADGGIERYSYTLSGNVVTGVTITDPLGRTMSKRFNAQGYVIEESDALGQVSVITRTIGTNTATRSDGPCGCLEAARTYDNRGNVLTVTDRLNKTESWQYRQFSPASSYDPLLNQATQYTDKRNNLTQYGYDTTAPNTLTPRGNLQTLTDARSKVTTYTYDPAGTGLLITVSDPLNNKREYTYDANGFKNNETVKRNSDQTVIYQTTYEHDLVGNLKKVTDGEGRISTMNYDNLDRMINETDPANATTTHGYDENGNSTSVTDALNRQATSSYDKKNRLEAETDPLARVTRWQYDAADQVLKVTSPSGRLTRYVYDERGQRRTVIDGLGNAVTFTYDNRGHVTTLRDQRGNVTTFEYDELFRLSGQRDPLGRLTRFEYDEVSNVKAKVDRLGRRIDILYDVLNRPQQATYADATVTYGYDDAYRWTSISDAAGTLTWSHDEAHRVKTETTNLGVLQYDYNKASQRKTMIAADRAAVTYNYDTAGRLQTIVQGSETFTYGYDTLSRQTSLARPNPSGVTTSYQYDQEDRLQRLTHVNASSVTLEDLQYEFNLDDEINKLISLASAPLTPASKTVSAADAANRIAQYGAMNLLFDAEGQTTSKTDAAGTSAYQWDARGRLTQVTLPNGQTVSYGYDALGRRTSRAAAGSTTTFQYDGADVVIDRVSGGSATDYLNGLGIDEKLRQTTGGAGALYFLTDHLGSAIAMADGLGAVTGGRSQYEAFGVSSGGAQTRYGFTNRELDTSTGLIYYRARWYDPQQGRFLSEDPIGYQGGLNLYSYVDNDPIRFADPLGLQSPRPTPGPSPSGGKEKCCDSAEPERGFVPPPGRVIGPGVRVAAGAGAAGFVATGGTIVVVVGLGALIWWLRPEPKPVPDNPYGPKPSSCPEPFDADKEKCRRAIKILEQFERLARDRNIKISPDRLQRLKELRDSGQIRISDLPGGLSREFPGEFTNDTLEEIRRQCRGK